MKLSILIPTLTTRAEYLTNLIAILQPQLNDDVELVINSDDGTKSIGEKRNELLMRAQGDYICFVDDDDEVSNKYVENILEALKSKPDCCSLTGVITWDDERPELFCHSIKYKEYKTNTNNEPIVYERYPNHLNAIKRSIAVKYSFMPIDYGEDTEWATQVFKGGELKVEEEIKEVLYHYKFKILK